MKQRTKQTKKCENIFESHPKGHEHNLGILQLQLIPPHISIAQLGEKLAHFSWREQKQIMESHPYLADKLSHFHLPFLSKSATLKHLNFGEMISWGRGSLFLLLLSLSEKNSIPLLVYPVNKRDEKEERKSLRGSRLC